MIGNVPPHPLWRQRQSPALPTLLLLGCFPYLLLTLTQFVPIVTGEVSSEETGHVLVGKRTVTSVLARMLYESRVRKNSSNKVHLAASQAAVLHAYLPLGSSDHSEEATSSEGGKPIKSLTPEYKPRARKNSSNKEYSAASQAAILGAYSPLGSTDHSKGATSSEGGNPTKSASLARQERNGYIPQARTEFSKRGPKQPPAPIDDDSSSLDSPTIPTLLLIRSKRPTEQTMAPTQPPTQPHTLIPVMPPQTLTPTLFPTTQRQPPTLFPTPPPTQLQSLAPTLRSTQPLSLAPTLLPTSTPSPTTLAPALRLTVAPTVQPTFPLTRSLAPTPDEKGSSALPPTFPPTKLEILSPNEGSLVNSPTLPPTLTPALPTSPTIETSPPSVQEKPVTVQPTFPVTKSLAPTTDDGDDGGFSLPPTLTIPPKTSEVPSPNEDSVMKSSTLTPTQLPTLASILPPVLSESMLPTTQPVPALINYSPESTYSPTITEAPSTDDDKLGSPAGSTSTSPSSTSPPSAKSASFRNLSSVRKFLRHPQTNENSDPAI